MQPNPLVPILVRTLDAALLRLNTSAPRFMEDLAISRAEADRIRTHAKSECQTLLELLRSPEAGQSREALRDWNDRFNLAQRGHLARL